MGAYSALGGDSPYGVADMTGNVWEWTHSLYKPYPYNAKDGRERPGTDKTDARVLRGGTFNFNRRLCRAAVRLGFIPFLFDQNYGFRICVSSILHAEL